MVHCKARLLSRLMAAALCCLLVAAASSASWAAAALELASQAAVLMDADTGMVLYEKNMDQPLYPASITKIMTALLTLQTLEPDLTLAVSQTAVDAVPRTSSHIALQPGERITVEEALYAIGMESANDAANVLAEAVSGNLEAFAERMTRQAQALGAQNTHFTNANGLPDSQHVTTAYDMALITAAALKQPGLAQYFSTVSHSCPATNLSDQRSFANKDRLLPGGQYYYEGVLLAKTGWTTSAQGTFAAAVKQGGTTLIVITLKSPLLEDKYQDAHKLLDYGFTHYSRVNVSGEQVTALLPLGDYTPVKEQKFSYLIPTGMLFTEIRYTLPEEVDLLSETRGSLTVPVSASIGDTALPGIAVALERPAPQQESDILEELLGAAPEQAQTVLRGPIVVLGAALVVFALYLLRRQVQRYRRRRHLKKRLDRMKKRME